MENKARRKIKVKEIQINKLALQRLTADNRKFYDGLYDIYHNCTLVIRQLSRHLKFHVAEAIYHRYERILDKLYIIIDKEVPMPIKRAI